MIDCAVLLQSAYFRFFLTLRSSYFIQVRQLALFVVWRFLCSLLNACYVPARHQCACSEIERGFVAHCFVSEQLRHTLSHCLSTFCPGPLFHLWRQQQRRRSCGAILKIWKNFNNSCSLPNGSAKRLTPQSANSCTPAPTASLIWSQTVGHLLFWIFRKLR